MTTTKRISTLEYGDRVRVMNDYAIVIENTKQVDRKSRWVEVLFANGKTMGFGVASNAKVDVDPNRYFCVYTNKRVLHFVCPDCNRFDCTVTEEELVA